MSDYAQVLRERIRAKLNEIGANPRGTDAKKLKQSETYRVRVGDYRILYNVDDSRHVVVVTEIGNRREIYR